MSQQPSRPSSPTNELTLLRQVLGQIRAASLQGLAKANQELTRADDAEDWENWSLWRGYRIALLEVLALTESLPAPSSGAPPPPVGPAATKSL
jgi:hypothetical protein